MAGGYWSLREKCKETRSLRTTDRGVVEKRGAESRARYLVEEGRCELQERHFDKAREHFGEANRTLKATRLRLVLFGLTIAPKVTGKLTSLWNRVISGATT